jgi:hypothetical protein
MRSSITCLACTAIVTLPFTVCEAQQRSDSRPRDAGFEADLPRFDRSVYLEAEAATSANVSVADPAGEPPR